MKSSVCSFYRSRRADLLSVALHGATWSATECLQPVPAPSSCCAFKPLPAVLSSLKWMLVRAGEWNFIKFIASKPKDHSVIVIDDINDNHSPKRSKHLSCVSCRGWRLMAKSPSHTIPHHLPRDIHVATTVTTVADPRASPSL